jgi:hypothetical protein
LRPHLFCAQPFLAHRVYLLYNGNRFGRGTLPKMGCTPILHSANIQTFFYKKGFRVIFFGYCSLSDCVFIGFRPCCGQKKRRKYIKIITFA